MLVVPESTFPYYFQLLLSKYNLDQPGLGSGHNKECARTLSVGNSLQIVSSARKVHATVSAEWLVAQRRGSVANTADFRLNLRSMK